MEKILENDVKRLVVGLIKRRPDSTDKAKAKQIIEFFQGFILILLNFKLLKIDFHEIADIFGPLNESSSKGFIKGVCFLGEDVKNIKEVSD